MNELSNGLIDPAFPTARFSPPGIVRRRFVDLGSIHADMIELTRREPFEISLQSSKHLLILTERLERDDGETCIEGLPKSTERDLSRKLTFIPAGHRFSGWNEPSVLARVTHLYIDPDAAWFDPEFGVPENAIRPRLFFFDQSLSETANKLKARAEIDEPGGRAYVDALGLVLLHELARADETPAISAPVRGGLAGWQQRRVAGYIDEHLAEDIPLAELARLAQLSPYHFARAFKQSLGLPPHRYHIGRRIERAKHLLSDRDLSVTQVALTLGFQETSSFTATFRKFAGRTPTEFRRALL